MRERGIIYNALVNAITKTVRNTNIGVSCPNRDCQNQGNYQRQQWDHSAGSAASSSRSFSRCFNNNREYHEHNPQSYNDNGYCNIGGIETVNVDIADAALKSLEVTLLTIT